MATLYINTFKQEPGGTKAYELQFSSDEKAVVNDHCCQTATRFVVNIKEDQERFPTLYWLPKPLFGLPRVPFVNCCQFLYLVISLLVLKAGCGI